MKQTNKTADQTSFHSTTIEATVNDLTKILGEPDKNHWEDKVTHEWTMETEEGDVFTVYDWKEYRRIEDDEIICWHIGGKSRIITEQAKDELTKELLS